MQIDSFDMLNEEKVLKDLIQYVIKKYYAKLRNVRVLKVEELVSKEITWNKLQSYEDTADLVFGP